jgi:hypothetical protein
MLSGSRVDGSGTVYTIARYHTLWLLRNTPTRSTGGHSLSPSCCGANSSAGRVGLVFQGCPSSRNVLNNQAQPPGRLSPFHQARNCRQSATKKMEFFKNRNLRVAMLYANTSPSDGYSKMAQSASPENKRLHARQLPPDDLPRPGVLVLCHRVSNHSRLENRCTPNTAFNP